MLYNYTLMKISLFFASVLNAYSMLIWVRIILSWIIPNPSRTNYVYWMGRLVDPYLKLFKNAKSSIGRLDFSPLIAVGIIYFFQGIFQYYGKYGTLTLSSVLYFFIMALWNYGLSIYFWVIFMALIFRLVSLFSRRGYSSAVMTGDASEPVENFVRSLAGRRYISDKAVCIISLVLILVSYFMVRYLVGWLGRLVLTVPF